MLQSDPMTMDPARDPAAIKKAQAQVAELKKMAAATAAARAERQAKKPLYERLGGRDAIKAVVTEVCELHYTDEITKPLFKGVDRGKLIDHVVNFLAQGAGGPEKYTGRDMVNAHKHLNMTDVHFVTAGDHIVRAMKKFGAGEHEIEEVICMIVAFHDDVIR